MVAETKEKMTEVFECWTDNVRATFDAGRRSHESVFKAVGDLCKCQPEFDGLFARTERAAKEFMPLVGKNLQVVTECVDTTFRAGMDVCKAACDSTSRSEAPDFYNKSRQVWDAAFGAARTHVEAIGKASGRTMENFTEFFRTACGESTSRTAPKPAK